MEIVINENNNKWKDTYDNKKNIRYLPYNKISNIIYTGKYNLLLNILNNKHLGTLLGFFFFFFSYFSFSYFFSHPFVWCPRFSFTLCLQGVKPHCFIVLFF